MVSLDLPALFILLACVVTVLSAALAVYSVSAALRAHEERRAHDELLASSERRRAVADAREAAELARRAAADADDLFGDLPTPSYGTRYLDADEQSGVRRVLS